MGNPWKKDIIKKLLYKLSLFIPSPTIFEKILANPWKSQMIPSQFSTLRTGNSPFLKGGQDFSVAMFLPVPTRIPLRKTCELRSIPWWLIILKPKMMNRQRELSFKAPVHIQFSQRLLVAHWLYFYCCGQESPLIPASFYIIFRSPDRIT